MEKNTAKGAVGSYKQVLKPTFIMGGSSIIGTLLGIVRIKLLAVIVGPSGVGLLGIYTSATNLVGTVSGFGIGESGIRQIAGASWADDKATISRTALCVRRMSFISGIAGGFCLFLTSGYLSRWTFGNSSHSVDFAILSVAIFWGAVSAGQTALIQGTRRIADLAKLSILSAFGGTVLTIPIIYLLGERGIVYYLLIVAAIGILASWWYSRMIEIDRTGIRWRDSFVAAKPLLRLGLAFMLGTLLSVLTEYLLRIIIIRRGDLDAVGVYQAATNLSWVYVGIILRAMVTDYYPRLSAAVNNIDEFNFLVNKQIEVGLLLAAPVVLATIALAPLVIFLFYSSKFMPAVDILRWQILGTMLQVVTWPMGYILRAKGSGKLFFWTELFAKGTLLSLAWVGLYHYGLPGIGMAFFGMNLLYGILILQIVRSYYGFSFSARNIQLSAFFFLTAALALSVALFLQKTPSLIINIVIAFAVGLFSVKKLFDGMETLPSFMLKIRSRFSSNL
jgi:antigen flippase